MLNVIGAIFAKESEAYQAMTELRQLPAGEEAVVLEMALIKRENNEFKLVDSYEVGRSKMGTVAGGIIGGLLGVFGGPVGTLLMGAYGMLVGNMVGTADSLNGAALIETVAAKMPQDGTAVVILADEKDDVLLDDALGKFDVEIFRFDAESVAAEVAEAANMQVELARQATMKLREASRERIKDKMEESGEILYGDVIEKATEQ